MNTYFIAIFVVAVSEWCFIYLSPWIAAVLQLVQRLHTKYQKDLDLKKLTFIICKSIRH